MRSAVVIIPLAFAAQAPAKELMTNYTSRLRDAQYSIDNLVEKLVDRVVEALPSRQAALDKTTLGKPGHIAISGKSLSGASYTRLRSPVRVTMHGQSAVEHAPLRLGYSTFAGTTQPLRQCHAAATRTATARETAAPVIQNASVASGKATSFDSHFIKLSGVRHHIRDTGEVDATGPIVVLMHGFAGSTDSWEQVAPLLAAGGCRAIAIDRVGFGRTERPLAPTLPAPPPLPFGAELAKVVESLGDKTQEGSWPLPDPRLALAMGLQRPDLLAPQLPWQLSQLGEDPYSSTFAVSALWPLLRERIGPSTSGIRPVYLVGHSAGSPIALRALAECASRNPSPLPDGLMLAGVALIAPAALDPREDPDIFDERQFTPRLFEQVPLPATWRTRAEVEARVAAFRAMVSLPDAFGLPTARRIAEGRDYEEAVRQQMHPRMSAPEFAPLVTSLAAKYSEPLREFPDEWDRGLLNVYRADLATTSPEVPRGRSLLAAARDARQKFWGLRMLVATGGDDRMVSAKASQRVAELLDAECFEQWPETGHLPMHERPNELASLLLEFFGRNSQ